MRLIDRTVSAELLGGMALATALGGPERTYWPLIGACVALGPRLLDRILLAKLNALRAPDDVWIVPDPHQQDWSVVLSGLAAAVELTQATGQPRNILLAPCWLGPGQFDAYRLTVAPASRELRLETATARAARPLAHLLRVYCPLPLVVSRHPLALQLAPGRDGRVMLDLRPNHELAGRAGTTAVAALIALWWDWRLAILLAGLSGLHRALTLRPASDAAGAHRSWLARLTAVGVATDSSHQRRVALLVAWAAGLVLLRYAATGTRVAPFVADPLRLALLGIALPMVLARSVLKIKNVKRPAKAARRRPDRVMRTRCELTSSRPS